MKITENTTLGELAAYLVVLGNPFITFMKAHYDAEHARHAIAYLAGVGSFTGSGATEAEALEAAFTQLRLKLLPEPLKQYVVPVERECGWDGGTCRLPLNHRGAHADRDPAFNKFRQTADQLCHGCGHTRDEHPNDSGCQHWHEEP